MRFLLVYLLLIFVPFSKGYDHFRLATPQHEISSLKERVVGGYDLLCTDNEVPDLSSTIVTISDDDSDFSNNKKKNLISGQVAAMMEKQLALAYRSGFSAECHHFSSTAKFSPRIYIYQRVLRI